MTEAWEHYLEKWRPWQQDHSRRSRVQRLYDQLFRMHQLQQQVGETSELIVGIGLLTWLTPAKQEVRRHLVAAQAELEFDPLAGVIRLRCPGPPDGARPRLEFDFLEATERPAEPHEKEAEALLREIGDDIWEPEGMFRMLRLWTGALHPNAQFSKSLVPPNEKAEEPNVSFAPAIIRRPRTARGLLLTYRTIIEQLESGGALPVNLLRLVTHLEDEGTNGLDSGLLEPTQGRATSPPLIYFPLPANEEQYQIAERLTSHRGLLVQGPPGTGKSQTIANLVCHLLATGQRVLITSETPRALRVLKDKIPKELRPLCVVLLGADTASFAELESSVGGITQRLANWNRERYRSDIENLERRLDEARRKQAFVERELREFREAETVGIAIGAGPYRGTAARIAQDLLRDQAEYGWLLPDHGENPDPPLSNAEASELLTLLRELGAARREELSKPTVPLERLPSVGALEKLVKMEKQLAERAQGFPQESGSAAFEPLRLLPPARRIAIREALVSFIAAQDWLSSRSEPWLPRALQEIFGGRKSTWSTLAGETQSALRGLLESAKRADALHVELPQTMSLSQISEDADTLRRHLAAGGRWSLLGIPYGPARGRGYLAREIRVDGRPASSLGVLDQLVHYLDTRKRIDAVWRLWEHLARRTPGPLAAQAVELEENGKCLASALDLLGQWESLRELLKRELSSMATVGLAPQDVKKLADVLSAAEAVAAADSARAETDRAGTELRELISHHDSHPAVLTLLNSLEHRDLNAWSEATSVLRSLEADRARLRRLQELQARLEAAHPRLARALEDTASERAWDQRVDRIESAWHWDYAQSWMKRRNEPGRYDELARTHEAVTHQIGPLKARLAAEKAWETFLRRLTQKQIEHLNAWKVEVKAIGKGTGKAAERHRAAARQYLTECISAIPAWIMPRYRVSETIEPRPEIFDVVIVDEASQTGVDGLFLNYMGKKIAVVGDDQQISPAGVGIPDAEVAELQNRFLADIPFQATLGPTNSLYQHAGIRFQGKIVLREHFRCVPEIIEFSNGLSYSPNGTPLVPLRQYPPARLAPVLSRFVGNGYQDGRSSRAQNYPEAEALVAQLVACLKSPEYAEKTFGVISLLGESQAQLIEQMLIEVVGPEEMVRRRLVCGDAYAFQGDERNVIFLSLVSAPNARIGVLATEAAKQRFNVAASRAQDQLWLFHSVRLDDLSPSCMRYRLLEYCLDPKVRMTTAGVAVHELRLLAGAANRQREEPPPPFESWFEVDVFLAVSSRGYRALPQFEVPGARIDIVVEGSTQRLAVECDGDTWHGLERYEEDMARQRKLERAGWKFFRITGSRFYQDTEGSLAPLWVELERLGIQKGGIEAAAQTPPEPIQLGAIARRNDSGAHLPYPVSEDDESQLAGAEVTHRKSIEHLTTGSATSQPVKPRAMESTTLPSASPRPSAPSGLSAEPPSPTRSRGPVGPMPINRRHTQQLVCQELQAREESLVDPRCSKCGMQARLEARPVGILAVCMDATCGEKRPVETKVLQRLADALHIQCYSCQKEALESHIGHWSTGPGRYLQCRSCGAKNYWHNVNERLEKRTASGR